MSHAIEFIETPIFTKHFQAMATDDDLKELQKELIAQPNKGDIIKDTGGFRKIRMAVNAGKSGGARVIYFLATKEVIYLVMVYPKNVKDTLTNTEKSALKKLAKQLKGEV